MALLAPLALAALAICPRAFCEEQVRHHGFRLDEKHLLLLEQRGNEIRIGISTRERNVGGVKRSRTRAETSEGVDRYGTVAYLATISSRVLKPSAPNYLSNPGERYRVVLEGLEADPDYVAQLEVDAIVARAAVLAELEKLGGRTHGIHREALHYAGPYALQILNESDLMPAPIPTSIKESQVGRIRFDNPALQRQSLKAGRDLFAGKKPKPTTLSPLSARPAEKPRAGTGNRGPSMLPESDSGGASK